MTVYTLFSQTGGGANVGNASGENLGLQFQLSQPCSLTGIWWNSPAGADALPSQIAIYVASAQTLVAGTNNSSPSWSGAAASGWVKCTYDGSIILSSGVAYEVIIHGSGISAGWYGRTSAYFSSGAGAGGVSNGPLSSPNDGSAILGNMLAAAGGFTYPTSTTGGNLSWPDVEVTTLPPAPAVVYQMRRV